MCMYMYLCVYVCVLVNAMISAPRDIPSFSYLAETVKTCCSIAIYYDIVSYRTCWTATCSGTTQST